MKLPTHSPIEVRLHSALPVAAVIAALLCLLAAQPALAAYEQVDTFAGNPGELHSNSEEAAWPEEVQLGGVGGMAVNTTGAGGVPPGTVYATSNTLDRGARIGRFNPDGSFSESWTFTENEDKTKGDIKERCGPDGEAAHPVCKSQTNGNTSIDVDVDQTTGYVYVLNGSLFTPGRNLVHVYSADGSELITEFGVLAATGETIATSPGKIHETSKGGIAIGAAGAVFVQDDDRFSERRRLMAFKPQSPGDYEHYVYAGQGSDVETEPIINPRRPVADAVGDLYVMNTNLIAKLDPSQPNNPVVCEFGFPKAHLDALTVNPQSGEVFFYSDADKKIHQLSSCEAGGEFKEVASFGFEPKRFELSAMAYDPTRRFDPGRPVGTLYAGAPSGEGGKEEGEKREVSLGYIFAPPPEFPPVVESQAVSHVTASTAELGAQINPKGPPTDYVFQYETQAEYEANEPADRFAGAREAPPGGGLLGEGPKGLSAAASLIGLQADTTYHYRAVATSHCSPAEPAKVCETAGAEQTFHTFPAEAPGLPDERVYELVSPALKGGGQVLPVNPGLSSCGPESSCKPGDVWFRFPIQSTPDGDAIAYEGSPFSDAGAVKENEYVSRRDPKAGWQTTTLSPKLQGGEGGYKAFDTALSTGLLAQSNPPLSSPEAPPGVANLYAQQTANPLAISPLLVAEPPNRTGSSEFRLTYAGAAADLSRVFFEANDALTGETPFAPEAKDGGAAKFNLYEWESATGQLRLVNVMPGNATSEAGASFGADAANTISDDGSRAFWSDGAGRLYVREGAEATKAIPDAGKFLTAATDGSKVLLADGHLYDLETEATTDLTEGKGGFQGLSGQSEDLSHVYFVDTEVLTGEEENSEGAKAQAGKFNLYAWAQGGNARYVATLTTGDGNGLNVTRTADWTPLPSKRTAEASPHGRYLTFLSEARLSGYDNTGPCKSDHAGGYAQSACAEVFLYDSATGELTCPSCNPTGVLPLGNSSLASISTGTTLLPQPRYLTDQGRLYFDTRDSLVVNDTNDGVEDVYQYEPSEVGGCKRKAGCLNLISAGREPIDSNFFAIDESARSVFFTSRDQLVLKDHDDLIDLYVAREKGGIPAETEVARSECQGEACVATYSPPNDPTPGSSSFEGAGNVDEKKAQKKHKKKRKHVKKNAKKRHKRSRANHNLGGEK
jgi:hypothetical protein